MHAMNLSYELLQRLEDTCGDSFYLADLQRFRANFAALAGAFRRHYAATLLAYSYKTNYTPRLCRIVDELGGLAEVVSELELSLARRLGIDPARVIVNGPGKSDALLRDALLAGALVNLDSLLEARLAAAIARSHPRRVFRVGLRCNLRIAGAPASRFGFDVSSSDFAAALALLRATGNCDVGGLHCHFVTPQRQPGDYKAMVQAMTLLASRHFSVGTLRFVDLGGGFMSPMDDSLRQQFPYPVPKFSDYADAIAPDFAAFAAGAGTPLLILEPGMALVADAVQFVAKVVDVKDVLGQRIAVASASVYDIQPTRSERQLPMTIVRASGLDSHSPERAGLAARVDAQPRAIEITGRSCMEDDRLQRLSGTLDPGDYLVFANAGAYSNVLRPPFISPCPPMVAVDAATGEFEVIKRRETADDVFAAYVF